MYIMYIYTDCTYSYCIHTECIYILIAYTLMIHQEATSRAERLGEQLRKAEADGVEVQRKLADSLHRCTAAEEKAVERGEQERRLRERAEAADAALLALRAELDKTVWCLHHMCLHISLFVFVMCLFIISVFIISDQQ